MAKFLETVLSFPTIISLVALGIALFTFYLNYLAPFDPMVTIGTPIFQFGNTLVNGTESTNDFDPNQQRILAAILLPVTVTHQGGKPGIIEDILLSLSRTKKNDKWIFEPRLFGDERAYVVSFDRDAHLKWIQAAFSPIPIARGAQSTRFILFQGRTNELFPRGGRLRTGEYEIVVLIKQHNKKRYREIDRIGVNFSYEVLTNLKEVNMKYSPPPESISQLRDSL